MTTTTSIRWLERVNRPYDKVHDVLSEHADEVFHLATSTAESLAQTEAADLHAEVAGIQFRKDILIKIRNLVDAHTDSDRKMVIELEWKAAESQRFFPTMTAELYVTPIKEVDTQLDFRGEYVPPLGFLGKTIDAILGQKIAERCVHYFVAEIAEYLRKTIDADQPAVKH